MASEDNPFTEFLDDYLAESEEHLRSLRRHLLVMEGFVDHRLQVDTEILDVVDELLRALHSLKGLSAMAGVSEAEQVAHAMEAALRNMLQAGTGPSESTMEALSSGTSLIERIVASRRGHKASPDIQSVLARLTGTGTLPRRLWRIHFSPNAELSARGVNVNGVRARLEEIGEVLSATPRIVEGGRIVFDFVLASIVDESQFGNWEADGLIVSVQEPAASDEAGIADPAAARSEVNVVRVDMKRLDHLMTLVGDLVISRGHMDESLRRLEGVLPPSAWRELQEGTLVLQRQIQGLREGVMRIRMIPIGKIFERMRFVIRGLERANHVDIRVESTGDDTEVDKLLVERMMDPLLHLVRNAVSHGLEPSEERLAAGKTREGHISLRASTQGETVVIELEDDGRGVNFEEIANRARVLGLMESGEHSSTTMDAARALQLMCMPGFTTRVEADLGAGRGVGMTVVKTTINGLGGTLAMNTETGKGTRFTIRLPLTLAIMQALIVYVDDQPFAVPRSTVHEVLRVETHTVTLAENNAVVPYRDGFLPIVYLRRLFNLNDKAGSSFHVFVAGSELSPVGIAVDRIAGQKEIVVQAVEDPLVRVPSIAGVTELGDGKPVLILDVAAIVDVRLGVVA